MQTASDFVLLIVRSLKFSPRLLDCSHEWSIKATLSKGLQRLWRVEAKHPHALLPP